MTTTTQLQDELKAIDIAIRAHRNQKRDDGEAYIMHVQRVASSFSIAQSDLIIVAYLHDVIEDHPEYAEEIRNNFSPKILEALMFLTKLPDENYYRYIVNLATSGNELAIQVKIADLTDNLDSKKTGSRADKYRLARHLLIEVLNDESN